MTKRINALLLGSILALSVVAVPSAADKETRQMMADIRMLQEQTQFIHNQVAALASALGEMVGTAVKTVNARVDSKVDEQSASTRKALTDQMMTINAIGNDVRTLREKLDDTTVRLGMMTQEVSALRQIVTHLNTVRTTYDPVLGPPDGAPPPPPAATVGASPTEFFNTAYSDYTAGQYDLAITGFQTYITTFPGDKADDAQVFICHSYYQGAKYKEAVDACDTAIRVYPASDKLPEAMFRKGQSLQSLKQPDRARAVFEELINKFPNSTESLMAKQRLASLGKP
jgi:tol-pal system protein YbgF